MESKVDEAQYFEQFTGEDVPTHILVFSGFTSKQVDEFNAAWEDYKKANPGWWKNQVITVVKQ